jgi:hypothetical protein
MAPPGLNRDTAKDYDRNVLRIAVVCTPTESGIPDSSRPGQRPNEPCEHEEGLGVWGYQKTLLCSFRTVSPQGELLVYILNGITVTLQ